MLRNTLCAGLVLAAITSTPIAAKAQDGPAILTPEQIGQIFCLARLGNDMAPAEALLTPELSAAIGEAEAKDAAWAAANPGDKPPLGDGIPWQSWPDYAPECTVTSASYEMDEARVRLHYVFPATPRADFTDTLNLKLIPGPSGWNVWRIDNVGYSTDSDLRTALTMAFMEN
jgi:hypothetical protein